MKRGTSKGNIDIIKDYLAGERPFVQIGYTGEQNKYREPGEVWIDRDGIKWKQEKGRKVRLTKTQGDIIREAIGDRKCKNCGMDLRWGNKFDDKFFSKTGMCYDCLVDYENKLHIVGLFDVYEKCKMLSNEIGFFTDVKAKLKETVDFFTNEDTSIDVVCNSEGFREKFHGTNKDQILKDAKNDLKVVRRHLTKITKELKKVKAEFKKGASAFKLKTYA